MSTPVELHLKQRSTSADTAGASLVQQVISTNPVVRGVYIHIPFCFHKCHYCDFYSFVDSRNQQEPFLQRMLEEIQFIGPKLSTPLETIFVGGGTPTLLEPERWRRLLKVIRGSLPCSREMELTVEANPETVTGELVEVLAAGGVNRVSIGAQTFHPRLLSELERWHDPANVARSMDLFRAAGITNLNLDLIFAIPTQTESQWLDDLETTIALRPSHISCYSLMYEPNTALTKKLQAGSVERVENDLEAAMYEATMARLARAGYAQYEISNFALPGLACRHNLLYWKNENWWPLGPSASGHVDGLRWKNVPRLGDYLAHGPLPPVVDVERLDEKHAHGEWLMLRLRMNEGIPRQELVARLSGDPARWSSIDNALKSGLLCWNDDALQFTLRGRMMADDVLADLV